MKRDELAPSLRKEYRDGLPCGVEKVDRPGLKNLWFVVPPSPPRSCPNGLPAASIAKANQVIENLPNLDQASELDKIISYLFIRREAVQSSRMEGTWSTIDHIFTPGEIYDAQEGKAERASVLGYAHALEKELEALHRSGPGIFSEKLVSRLHREIMAHDPLYKGTPGKIRKAGDPGDVVFIGGLRRHEESIYNPTPPRHVERGLRDVVHWLKDEELIELGNAGMGMALPVRMAIGHSHFEAVHPFPDGNGRVGRMLMTLQMASHPVLPLYLSGYIESERESYSHALQKAQKKLSYGEIVELICSAIIASQREHEQTRSLIGSLPETWRARGRFRARSAADQFLPKLLTQPIFTAKQIAKTLKVSLVAANNAAAQLVERKIVRQRSEGHWGRVFAAEEVTELLSRRFGDDPSLALEKARGLLGSRSQWILRR